MPWIENVSLAAIPKGLHHDAGPNSMLIRIHDPGMMSPYATPKHQFKEVHYFEFLDIEDADECINDVWKISDSQAAELVRLLQHALDNHMNVLVHCHAGVCRSGAVAEVGVIMGFNDCERFRIPNLRVKTKMMRVLGLTYD